MIFRKPSLNVRNQLVSFSPQLMVLRSHLYYLTFSQLSVVESALTLESEDLDLRPDLTSKET